MSDEQLWTREEALEKLRAINGSRERIKEWNDYRNSHWLWPPDLSDEQTPANLQDVVLADTTHRKNEEPLSLDLNETNLAHAILARTNLAGVKFANAKLNNSFMLKANLAAADLRHANLTGARLRKVNLTGAHMAFAILTGADLMNSTLRDADLRAANLTNTNVVGVIYNRCALRGKCMGARVATCYGNAIFKRDVEDQDFIDTLEEHLKSERKSATSCRSKLKAWWNLALFRAWGWIDYGRSMWLASLFAIRFAFLFGLVFFVDMKFLLGLIDYSGSANSLFTPFYYSIVTYTTLGFGDVTPMSWGGELLVVIEVLFGYVTLGLLISILANKVARRS